MRASLSCLLLACASVPPPTPSCRDAGCEGCCDSINVCRGGDLPTACGSGGAACASCPAGQFCGGGRCIDLPPGCGPASCAGCCVNDQCRAGRSIAECGAGGATCSACAPGSLCSAGACLVVGQCDLGCGAQCCRGAACAGTPCGFDGGACSTCPAGERCAAGACTAAAGARWRVRIVSAQVEPLRPSGEPWDEFNDPDPKVCANVGDAGSACTLELTDTFSPAWNTLFPASYDFAQLQRVELAVIDADFPGQTLIDELGVLDLRPRWNGTAQRWTLDGASVKQLRIDVEPAP